MCPDVICGRCWYCRNTFGYPFCEQIRGYGTGFSCADPPHLFTGYAASLRLMERYRSTFPFERIVTHRFPLENAEGALKRSIALDTMKVVVEP